MTRRMTQEEWITVASVALRGAVQQLRQDAIKLHMICDYLEAIADQAPIPPRARDTAD